MAAELCPRCLSSLRPPDPGEPWQCDRDGPVSPYRVVDAICEHELLVVAANAAVPVWLPWPLPMDWTVTGLGYAGQLGTGGFDVPQVRATALACAGPSPFGGDADLVLVAEEPGVGLGARLAGLPAYDPGPPSGVPETRVDAAGRPTALWPVAGAPPDRVAFVGEALGVWLWAVLWPEPAGLIMLEKPAMHDLRDGSPPGLELVFGPPSPYLRGGLPGA